MAILKESVTVDILFIFIIGLFIGSFYNVVAMRTLKGESIVVSRSHCTSCGHILGPLDLVPVFSYIFLRGRCRYCKVKISPLYCFGELITGITLAYLYWIFGLSFDFAIHAMLGSMLVILVISDLLEKTIPNKIVLVGLLTIFILRIIKGERILFYILSSLGIFSLLFLVMIMSGDKLGGGDVKLYAVIGLAIGIWGSLVSLFLASLFALLLIMPLVLTKRINMKHPVPFVPFVWAGVLASYLVEINLF